MQVDDSFKKSDKAAAKWALRTGLQCHFERSCVSIFRLEAMNEDQRELIRRLFVAAAERLELALELAMKGQLPRARPASYANHAANLCDAAREASILADCAEILARRASK